MRKFHCSNDFNKNKIRKINNDLDATRTYQVINPQKKVPLLAQVGYQLEATLSLEQVNKIKLAYYHSCKDMIETLDNHRKLNKKRTRNRFIKLGATAATITLIVVVAILTQLKLIELNIDGHKKTISTKQYFTPLLINKLSNEYSLNDYEFESSTGDTIKPGTNINIKTLKNVDVKVKNKMTHDQTYVTTLKEYLEEKTNNDKDKLGNKYTYHPVDYVGKEDKTLLTDVNVLNLALKSSTSVDKQEISKFKTQYVDNKNLEIGQERVKQKGVNGKYIKRYETIYLNDKKHSTKTTIVKVLTKKQNKIIEVGTKPGKASTTKKYTLGQFMSSGVINWNGYKFTYYSQSVLPGGGLAIPGRHVNKDGYVADKDGYIVLASSAPKGQIFNTPFGYKGKVYDRGVSGNHLDVYIR